VFSGGRTTLRCSTGKFPVTWRNGRKRKPEQIATKRLHSERDQKLSHNVALCWKFYLLSEYHSAGHKVTAKSGLVLALSLIINLSNR